MELHQLRQLCAVVDHGSFTAAAAATHVSQSGISAQVAKLERELGQTLLERLPRAVRLTPAGEQLLPLVRRALDAVDQIPAIADEITGLVRGQVRVAMAPGCTMTPFLTGIAAFTTSHPGVTVSLTEGPSDELVDGVANGRYDLALTGFVDDVPPRLDSLVLVDEPLAAAFPAGHRLAGRATSPVRISQLAGENLLCLPRGAGVREAWRRIALRAEADDAIGVEASSPEALQVLVLNGLGPAVLTRSMVTDPALVVREITPSIRARFGLLSRREGSPAATALLTQLRHAFTH